MSKMNNIGLSRLSHYLKSSKKDLIFLTLIEIEEIIGSKLPEKAQKPNWWYNDCRKAQANVWLSVNYKTVDTNTIPARCGVCFQKFQKTRTNKIRYNKLMNILVLNFIFPILTGLFVTLLGICVSNHIEINSLMNKIQLSYTSSEFARTEDLVYTAIPLLQKNKSFENLCSVYSILYEIKYNEFLGNGKVIDKKQVDTLIQICSLGIETAEETNNLYYTIQFNIYYGQIYQHIYENTYDMGYANFALEYFHKADDLYTSLGNGLVPVMIEFESEEDMQLAMLGLEANVCVFEMYEALIENDEYDLEQFFSVLDENNIEKLIDSTFFRLFQYCLRVALIQFDINCKLENAQMEIGNEYSLLCLRAISTYSRYQTIYYLLSTEHQTVYDFDKELANYEKVKESLINIVESAKNRKEYNILALSYFQLARVNYYAYIYEDNYSALDEFTLYLQLWLEISDQENLSLRDFDRYYSTINSGELLGRYILELENTLKNFSFNDNPAFYAYTCWELAKHYYYQAEEFAIVNKDYYIDAIACVEYNCHIALSYFTEHNNPRVYNEIQTMLADAANKIP